ncbi:unnamed protein product [Amoebophrya sp. A120]|nr:unnamed protein product [Amoebophrya sp. A120]|eukprot:GSA120T00010204001.1
MSSSSSKALLLPPAKPKTGNSSSPKKKDQQPKIVLKPNNKSSSSSDDKMQVEGDENNDNGDNAPSSDDKQGNNSSSVVNKNTKFEFDLNEEEKKCKKITIEYPRFVQLDWLELRKQHLDSLNIGLNDEDFDGFEEEKTWCEDESLMDNTTLLKHVKGYMMDRMEEKKKLVAEKEAEGAQAPAVGPAPAPKK